MTRREFMTVAAGGATIAGLPLLSAKVARNDLNLGFSLYGMKALPLERALAECARIGYRNIELALITGFPTEPGNLTRETRTAVRRQIAASGLPVSSLLINLSLAAEEKDHRIHLKNLRIAALFAAEIDPVNPPIVQTVMGGTSKDWEAKKALMAVRLREWNLIARDHGITLALRAHVMSGVNTPERLLWMLREADGSNLAVAHDYIHYALGGISLEDSIRPLASQIKFVHLKDARREGNEVRFLLPGDGETDYAAYFQLLEKYGYHGPLVVEVSSQIFSRPDYDPIAAAEKAYAALTRA